MQMRIAFDVQYITLDGAVGLLLVHYYVALVIYLFYFFAFTRMFVVDAKIRMMFFYGAVAVLIAETHNNYTPSCSKYIL